MDTRSMKAAAEWFRSTVFKDEAIRPGAAQHAERLPAALSAARSLENVTRLNWQSRESVFLKQAKLLANYEEDEYGGSGSLRHYYTTYQSLSDRELRSYFSWRTKLRRGELQETSLSFAFLYVYELLNQVGAADPMDGYRKLTDFLDAYGQMDKTICPYLERWIVDYVIYYDLDPALLADSPQAVFDRSVAALERMEDKNSVICAVKALSPKWLERSRFYAAYQEDVDEVIFRVLRRVSRHYERCKKPMVEQYFGSCGRYQLRLFDAAVFCNPLKRRDYEYVVDEQYICRCENGVWTVWRRTQHPSSKLEALLKTIDSIMRREFDYHHPVKAEMNAKWVIGIIEEEVQGLLAEQKAAEERKITIDYGQLTRIRRDAAITQEKLIVEEEEEPELPSPPVPAAEPDLQAESPLSQAERRLLRCLLYGGDTGWVQREGHLLSVLVDGVNEKLYDLFQDAVLDDAPQVVEDYIDDLKEMVRP